MSTLTVQTISNGTVSTSSANVIQGSAKAWVRFNASSGTPSINASYNVSSITDNGVGYYTINMTNAMVDANYAVTTSVGNTTYIEFLNVFIAPPGTFVAPTASSFVVSYYGQGANRDPQTVNITVFR
jgi:hypothetical protein